MRSERLRVLFTLVSQFAFKLPARHCSLLLPTPAMSFSVSFNDSARTPLMGGGQQQQSSLSTGAPRSGGSVPRPRANRCAAQACSSAAAESVRAESPIKLQPTPHRTANQPAHRSHAVRQSVGVLIVAALLCTPVLSLLVSPAPLPSACSPCSKHSSRSSQGGASSWSRTNPTVSRTAPPQWQSAPRRSGHL